MDCGRAGAVTPARESTPRVYSASVSSAYDAGGELRIANCHFVLAGHHRDLALARVADVGDHGLRPGDDIGIRLLRDDVVIHEGGKLQTLKRFKDDVNEVQSGQECGMSFENYQDIKPGDLIECFNVEVVQRSL